jgi:hypothetical protein
VVLPTGSCCCWREIAVSLGTPLFVGGGLVLGVVIAEVPLTTRRCRRESVDVCLLVRWCWGRSAMLIR